MRLFDKIFGRAKKTGTQNPGQLNPDDTWLILPTVSNEFPQTTATAAATAFDIHLHEDDYRQNEFLSRSSMPLIEKELAAIKNIWENSSKKSGDHTVFKNCHVRKTIGEPGLAIPFAELTGLLNIHEIGTVKINDETLNNSFAFRTGNTTFYGTKSNETVSQLCISAWNENTIKEITVINARYDLVFANWYHAAIIREND